MKSALRFIAGIWVCVFSITIVGCSSTTNVANGESAENASISQPQLLRPINDRVTWRFAIFDWTDSTSTDPIDIAYRLQVATDRNFTDTVINIDGISESYLVLPTNIANQLKLDVRPHWWKVQAYEVGKKSNTSRPTRPGKFKVIDPMAPQVAGAPLFSLVGVGRVQGTISQLAQGNIATVQLSSASLIRDVSGGQAEAAFVHCNAEQTACAYVLDTGAGTAKIKANAPNHQQAERDVAVIKDETVFSDFMLPIAYDHEVSIRVKGPYGPQGIDQLHPHHNGDGARVDEIPVWVEKNANFEPSEIITASVLFGPGKAPDKDGSSQLNAAGDAGFVFDMAAASPSANPIACGSDEVAIVGQIQLASGGTESFVGTSTVETNCDALCHDP